MPTNRSWPARLLALTAITATALAATVALPTPALAAGAPYRATPVPVTAPTSADVTLVPGVYLVTFRPGADRAVALRALRTTARADFGTTVNGFAAALTPAQVRELSHSADVLAIEQDAWHHGVLDTTQANPPAWGIDRVDQTNLPLSASYTYTATGAGVHAYIIDSGIDAAHPNFGGRARFDYNAIDTNNTDCNSHGTHVAGTIGSTSYGVAKAVTLHGVKWLNCAGSGTTSAAVAAVNWVRTNHVKPAVANTSWNMTYSATLATALTNLMNAGVFLATSAGNTGGNSCDRLPRNLTAALVVAATTSADARASYSSTGTCVDLYGPGSGIVSTVPGGGTGSKNGTSMSTPHAAGIAVLYKSAYGDASQSVVHSWIVTNSTAGVVTGSLSGTPNRLLNKRAL
ncbi:serine protease [Catellatospora methionotrophica]|uniref:Serine protease n=1 Tax=Catellatospora methionotrophica TaxID=121620 RepID=A0A8J3PE01_9ACTN|nr:S8 family peptidase [Catellatospora methionotrophica]GIG12858.1 serine protease [Catellatospora methionotrophica]